MKTFNITRNAGTVINGREMSIGSIYGNFQGTVYYCESLFQPKKGYLYIHRYIKGHWTREEPVRCPLTDYILLVCAKHGISSLEIIPVMHHKETEILMKHSRGFKSQGSCMKTAQKLRTKRGDSPDFDKQGNYGYARFKDISRCIYV